MDKQQVHQTHGDIAKRLKRAEGHLRSMVEMIEAERPCADIAQQLHALFVILTITASLQLAVVFATGSVALLADAAADQMIGRRAQLLFETSFRSPGAGFGWLAFKDPHPTAIMAPIIGPIM